MHRDPARIVPAVKTNERNHGREAVPIGTNTALGLVGLGQMGLGVAENLIKSGFRLTVHARSKKVRAWAGDRAGVELTDSLSRLGRVSDVVLILVTDNRALEEVLHSEDGILDGMARDGLIIDMTTGSPTIAIENHRRLSERGIRMLEAPMTGGATGARDATLLLMVGGDEQLCKDCQPLFASISRKVIYAGGPGKGQTLKLLQNQLAFALFFATCEAMWVGTSVGFTEDVLIDVFQNSNARNYETEVRFPRFILPRTFNSGGAVYTAHKDSKLVTDLERDMGVELPLATTVHAYLDAALRRFGPTADYSRAYQLVTNEKELQELSSLARRQST
jgi:3-hydroxyisobutyrate dehydrogenase-like beta-hydroxyacid dehydrogenase